MSAQVFAFKPPVAIGDSTVGPSSAEGLFGEYMLMELVLEVARSSNDPHGRLAELFDRINLRADSGGMGKGAMLAQFRKHAETFFIKAAKNV